MITKSMYLATVKDALREFDLVTADTLNKLALETEAIPLDYYRAAARILVEVVLNR